MPFLPKSGCLLDFELLLLSSLEAPLEGGGMCDALGNPLEGALLAELEGIGMLLGGLEGALEGGSPGGALLLLFMSGKPYIP
jgi:hypothetical protein